MYLITRKDRLFTHIGIYLNESQIIHFSSKTNSLIKNDKIVKYDDLKHFSRNRCIKLVEIKSNFTEADIIHSAHQFYGKYLKYHIIKNNCYSFVLWCLYQKRGTSLKDILAFTHYYKIPITACIL